MGVMLAVCARNSVLHPRAQSSQSPRGSGGTPARPCSVARHHAAAHLLLPCPSMWVLCSGGRSSFTGRLRLRSAGRLVVGESLSASHRRAGEVWFCSSCSAADRTFTVQQAGVQDSISSGFTMNALRASDSQAYMMTAAQQDSGGLRTWLHRGTRKQGLHSKHNNGLPMRRGEFGVIPQVICLTGKRHTQIRHSAQMLGVSVSDTIWHRNDVRVWMPGSCRLT